jgi:hypothetical protein
MSRSDKCKLAICKMESDRAAVAAKEAEARRALIPIGPRYRTFREACMPVVRQAAGVRPNGNGA